MVYEIKCHNCGEIMDWGGEKPEESMDPNKEYPDDIMKFDDNWYCKDCVEKFVVFGIGEIEERIEWLEDRMEQALDTLGISKAGGPPSQGEN